MNGLLPLRSRAFTLIELLVACAILAVLVVLFTQITGSVVNTYQGGKGRAESNAIGRALLDAMDKDLKQIVVRPDLATFSQDDTANSSALKFYSTRPGVFYGTTPSGSGLGAARHMSIVEYIFYRTSEKEGYLARRDRAATWTTSSSIVPLGTTNAIASLNEASEEIRLYRGILGFDWQYLRTDGSMDKLVDATRPIAAVRVSVAVIDEKALAMLKDSGRLSEMMGLFSSPPSAGKTGVTLWEERLRQASSFPGPVMQGVRFYERFIKIPQAS